MKKKERIQLPTELSWREGYNLGVQQTLRENDIALKIGRAIVSSLDERYEFKKEDY